jgi:hypothetical protein
MARDIEVVRALWRGESRTFAGPEGRDVEISVLPRPVQPELPVWVTSAGDPETFRLAGQLGANVLTHLLGQTIEALAERIRIYRDAWREAGHPGRGQVTLMLHTFIDEDEAFVREAVREPMISYLRSSVGLIKQFASSFPTFRNLPETVDAQSLVDSLSPEDLRDLLDVAFERYYETSALFGTPGRAAAMVERVHKAGVDEIACLVDFGMAADPVELGLERLAQLVEQTHSPASAATQEPIDALIRRHGVTHVQCTPSQAALLLAEDDVRHALGQVATVLVGGEALPADLARELLDVAGGRVLNMYGPTETTIWSTTSPVTAEDAICSIGTPIANTSVYVLDAQQARLPVGFVGELWIGGEGVSRGYLGREDLTAERFRPDPFAPHPGARMYRTGDLARVRPDGNLEFLGRADQQVKLRGYRIEPGEIESAIRSVAEVEDAVVIAREDTPGDQRLVGYQVARGARPSEDDLRQRLAASLPDYMVPTHFVFMDRLPLTPNAKIDRSALPRLSTQAVATPSTIDPLPTSGALTLVEDVWREVLCVPDLPRDRTFFDLGGNSMLQLQVHKQLKQHHPGLRLTDLFKHPTVSALAAHLSPNPASTTVVNDGSSRANARRAALARRPVSA